MYECNLNMWSYCIEKEAIYVLRTTEHPYLMQLYPREGVRNWRGGANQDFLLTFHFHSAYILPSTFNSYTYAMNYEK